MKFRFLLLATSFAMPASAQRLEFQLLGGAGMNGTYERGVASSELRSLILPRVSAGLRIRLTPHVALLSGVTVQQKGFGRTNRLYDTTDGSTTTFNSSSRYTQLHIPLQISVTLRERGNWGIELNAGMSYGFMLAAVSDWQVDVLRQNGRTSRYDSRVRPRIALMPYDSRLAISNPLNYGALSLFNPAFDISATLVFRKRFLLQPYFEYNLYETGVRNGPGQANLYSAGLAIGVRL